ncbi:MAG: hypothetical protein DWQ01_00025 [Planctomycetota bacterium]|nr:MAG: hypothetical protein DWQ01_00025 [Planctomycetota bacterium]
MFGRTHTSRALARTAPALILAAALAPAISAQEEPVEPIPVPGHVDFASVLPADTLAHVELDVRFLGQLLDGFELNLEEYVDDPEIRQILDQVIRITPILLEPTMQDVEQSLGIRCEDILPLLSGRFCASFFGFHQRTVQYPDIEVTFLGPDIMFGFQYDGEQAGHLFGLLKHFQGWLEANGATGLVRDVELGGLPVLSISMPYAPTEWWVRHEADSLLVATNKDRLHQALVRNRNLSQGALADFAGFADASDYLRRPGNLLFTYCNWQGLLNLLGESGSHPMVQALAQAAPFMSVGSALNLSAEGLQGKMFVQVLDEKWAAKVADSLAGPFRSYQLVPEGPGVVESARFGFVHALDSFFGLIEQVDRRQAAQMQGALRNFERQAGFSLREDMLAHLGPEATFYFVMPSEQWYPDLGLILQVQDQQVAESLMLELAMGLEDMASITKLNFHGHEVHYLDMDVQVDLDGVLAGLGSLPAPKPAWTFLGDYLVIAPWPEALAKVIARFQALEKAAETGPVMLF